MTTDYESYFNVTVVRIENLETGSRHSNTSPLLASTKLYEGESLCPVSAMKGDISTHAYTGTQRSTSAFRTWTGYAPLELSIQAPQIDHRHSIRLSAMHEDQVLFVSETLSISAILLRNP